MATSLLIAKQSLQPDYTFLKTNASKSKKMLDSTLLKSNYRIKYLFQSLLLARQAYHRQAKRADIERSGIPLRLQITELDLLHFWIVAP